MEHISERPRARAWTCDIRMRERRLPDIAAIAKHLHDFRVGATLRGVETTLDGTLFEEEGSLLLKLADSTEAIRLTPLTQKVEWDPDLKSNEAATVEEQNAYARLQALRPELQAVEIAGPLRAGADGRAAALEVRLFRQLE